MVVAGQEAMCAGDFDAAARFLQAALAIEPSPEAHDTLAYLAYIDDDYEEAQRQWELAYHGCLTVVTCARPDSLQYISRAPCTTGSSTSRGRWLGSSVPASC
jgi:hypothetical protein